MKRIIIALVIILMAGGTVWGADKPLSQLTEATAVTSDDLLLITDAPGTVPASKKITITNFFGGTLAANYLFRWDGTNFAGIASSADMVDLLGSATYAAARTKLSLAAYTDLVAYWEGGACSGYLKSDGTCDSPSVTDIFTGAMTDNHLVTYDSATGKLQDAGAARTDNATASHFIYIDSDGHIENATTTGSGTTMVLGTSPTFTTSILAASNANIGSADAEFGNIYLGDGKVIYFQNDQSVYLTPSTGLLTLTGNFVATGTISGKVPMITKTDSYTLGTDSAQEAYGYMVWMSGANKTLTLPAVVAGMSVCLYSTDANIKRVDPNGSDGIRMGAARDTDGDAIACEAATGAYVCLIADGADGWTVLGKSGTWAAE
jgi:hypothetical protein